MGRTEAIPTSRAMLKDAVKAVTAYADTEFSKASEVINSFEPDTSSVTVRLGKFRKRALQAAREKAAQKQTNEVAVRFERAVRLQHVAKTNSVDLPSSYPDDDILTFTPDEGLSLSIRRNHKNQLKITVNGMEPTEATETKFAATYEPMHSAVLFNYTRRRDRAIAQIAERYT